MSSAVLLQPSMTFSIWPAFQSFTVSRPLSDGTIPNVASTTELRETRESVAFSRSARRSRVFDLLQIHFWIPAEDAEIEIANVVTDDSLSRPQRSARLLRGIMGGRPGVT